jgi:hypothetical protein
MSLLLDSKSLDQDVPDFQPHPLLWNGHLQTIVARYIPGPRVALPSTYHEIDIAHGNRLTVVQSIPSGWQNGDPAVVLVHGLAGDVRSPYLSRVGLKLFRMGIRVFRMNMRGAGAGYGLSRNFYHGGRSEDPRSVLEWVAKQAPGSPIAAVGFSLGANLVLKMSGEAADDAIEGFDCVIAANPPLDLYACCLHIRKPESKVYDQNFIRLLQTEEGRLREIYPDDHDPIDFSQVGNLFEFDTVYTAPRNGFEDAEDYYSRSSSAPLIPRITIPGLVIHAADDPFIPVEPFLNVQFPPQLAFELSTCGGHLGYMSRTNWLGDRRWLDARIASWLGNRWGLDPELSSVKSETSRGVSTRHER